VYFLLLSLSTVTTTWSRPSASWTFSAPITLAPDEIPTASPALASFCAMMIESPSDASITGSSSFSLTSVGMNSSEMPWMRCWPTCSRC